MNFFPRGVPWQINAVMVAQWAHVPAWSLYGGQPEDWRDWYEVTCRGVEGAREALAKPPTK